jgi:8-oxo-dGTP pyrophosphatase MutT (NUDIX family)
VTVETTWDGLPISREPPYGAAVLVWRRAGAGVEWLVLHRAHRGRAYEGDWAWTPPAGARQPGETIEECAARELREESGLELECRATPCGSGDWAVFAAEAPAEAEVVLDSEHDAYEWLPAEEAAARCLPASVGAGFRCVGSSLE